MGRVHHITMEEKQSRSQVGSWVGWSNLILEPTLALIKAQLGFRIQVRAECGNNEDNLKNEYDHKNI